MAHVLGGFSETTDATEQVQEISDEVKCQVEETTKKIYEVFRAVKYRSQLVQGKNYLIKVDVGGCAYLHLSVFQQLPCEGGEIKLCGVQECHSKDDPIVPF